MLLALQITFRHMDPSPAVEAHTRESGTEEEKGDLGPHAAAVRPQERAAKPSSERT
jgi:hypothetical protein